MQCTSIRDVQAHAQVQRLVQQPVSTHVVDHFLTGILQGRTTATPGAAGCCECCALPVTCKACHHPLTLENWCTRNRPLPAAPAAPASACHMTQFTEVQYNSSSCNPWPGAKDVLCVVLLILGARPKAQRFNHLTEPLPSSQQPACMHMPNPHDAQHNPHIRTHACPCHRLRAVPLPHTAYPCGETAPVLPCGWTSDSCSTLPMPAHKPHTPPFLTYPHGPMISPVRKQCPKAAMRMGSSDSCSTLSMYRPASGTSAVPVRHSALSSMLYTCACSV